MFLVLWAILLVLVYIRVSIHIIVNARAVTFTALWMNGLWVPKREGKEIDGSTCDSGLTRSR